MAKAAETLAKDVRQGTAAELQGMLVSLIDLSLQAKQAHWNVVGRHFRSLHLELDELVNDTREWSDEVAERIRALDLTPDGRVGTVAKQGGLTQPPAGTISDRDVVNWAVEQIRTVAGQARAAENRMEESDNVSQDLLIEIVEGLEKHLWMFRAQQE